MSNNVVDFKKRKHLADHAKKEAGFDQMKQRFEVAFPNEKTSKDKLLNVFKKAKNTRTPKKKQ